MLTINRVCAFYEVLMIVRILIMHRLELLRIFISPRYNDP
jgi:hypothetical protein